VTARAATLLKRDPQLPFARRPPGQIGMLVEDLHACLRGWSAALGREDWLVYTYGPHNLKNATYRGRAAAFSMRLAIIGSEPQIELIQPVEGPSIYTEWVAERGYGLHHIGFYVESIADAVGHARRAGFEPIQSAEGYGVHGDGGFAYFDTSPQLGVITELIEVPSVRRPNEYASLLAASTLKPSTAEHG
jgi:methylmalonyl-CoA/ethylmalonyl-CoA epimerase